MSELATNDIIFNLSLAAIVISFWCLIEAFNNDGY